jgi:hypothetical protein
VRTEPCAKEREVESSVPPLPVVRNELCITLGECRCDKRRQFVQEFLFAVME